MLRDVLGLRLGGIPDRELEALVMSVVGVSREQLWRDPRLLSGLSQGEIEVLQSAIDRRLAGEPLAYILGKAPFWRDVFVVTPATLIPRPETEMLVEHALAIVPSPRTIVDIGTGSGCIALSLARELPLADVEGWDLCADALAVAKGNARRLGLDQVRWRQVDMTSEQAWPCPPSGRVDLIVANPPYISLEEWEALDPSVRDHEPRKALLAGDVEGVGFYEILARQAGRVLTPKSGTLLVEIGYRQLERVVGILACHGWLEIESYRDLSGHPRVVRARRPHDTL